jgi:hypothetical protein
MCVNSHDEQEVRILILGLDNAGKTTILNRLHSPEKVCLEQYCSVSVISVSCNTHVGVSGLMLCVCVCVCVCECICMYVCMHAFMYVYVCMCVISSHLDCGTGDAYNAHHGVQRRKSHPSKHKFRPLGLRWTGQHQVRQVMRVNFLAELADCN